VNRCALSFALDISHNLSVMSDAQADRMGHAKSVIKRLLQFNYVGRMRVLAVPPLPIDGPLFECLPGGKKPDFAPLAHAVSRRAMREATEVTIYFATSKAARAFAGHSPCLSRVGQLGHDLAVTECLIALRHARPVEAARWVSEALFIRRHRRAMGRFIPDAAIGAAAGARLETAIDFAGPSYSAERLTEIWRAAWTAGMKLEIWGEPGRSLRSSLATAG
jgi:hypothetical protein